MIKTRQLILIVMLVSGLFINSNIFGNEAKKVKVTSSSIEGKRDDLKHEHVIDGDMGTRWSSEFGDPQWIMLDFGKKVTINKVSLFWEGAFGKAYQIQVSNNAKKWDEVYSTTNGNGSDDEISFNPVSARYIRVYCTKRGLDWAGYSLYEFEVYNGKVSLTSSRKVSEVPGILKSPSFERGTGSWRKSGNARNIGRFSWHHYDGAFSYGIGNDEGPDNAYGEVFQEIPVISFL